MQVAEFCAINLLKLSLQTNFFHVNAEVRLQNATHAENIAIQINRCWATPTNDLTVEELILVTDGCPHQTQNELEDMNTLVSNSGDGISARYQFDVFGFTSSAAVHIHCAIEICSVANSFECRRIPMQLLKRNEFNYIQDGI